jgi:hypothetical protein
VPEGTDNGDLIGRPARRPVLPQGECPLPVSENSHREHREATRLSRKKYVTLVSLASHAPIESLPVFSAARASPDLAALIFSAYCSGIRADFHHSPMAGLFEHSLPSPGHGDSGPRAQEDIFEKKWDKARIGCTMC